ncbi:CARDB domain-containing protein, partial [Gemmatimonadota bacterium]
LVVSSLTHAPASPTTDDPVTLAAVVRNDGNATAGASVLRLQLTGAGTTTHSVPTLGPGQTYQVQRSVGTLANGLYTVTATADVNNTVVESNEGNNLRNDGFTVAVAPRPDLVVSSLTHLPTNPTTDDAVTLTAVVRNDGNASAGASVLRLQLTGASTTTHSVPTLGPGQTYQVQRSVGTLANGLYTVTATADINNTVVESSDGNNLRNDGFTVAIAPRPDLLVNSLTYYPVNPNTNDPITLYAVVRNNGNTTAVASTLRFEVTGASTTTHGVPALASGQTYQVVRSLGTLGPGTYTVTATADVYNTVAESDEGNNVSSVGLEVVAAPVLFVSPTSLSFSTYSSSHNPSPKTFLVGNIGGQSLSWSIQVQYVAPYTCGTAWLSVSPLSGSGLGPLQSQTVTVDPYPCTLNTTDTVNANIRVTSNGGSQTVAVEYYGSIGEESPDGFVLNGPPPTLDVSPPEAASPASLNNEPDRRAVSEGLHSRVPTRERNQNRTAYAWANPEAPWPPGRAEDRNGGQRETRYGTPKKGVQPWTGRRSPIRDF